MTTKHNFNTFTLTLKILGDMLIRQGVLESEMSDLIQAHSDDNSPNGHFPSNLGSDLNEELKNKLSLYLVSLQF